MEEIVKSLFAIACNFYVALHLLTLRKQELVVPRIGSIREPQNQFHRPSPLRHPYI